MKRNKYLGEIVIGLIFVSLVVFVACDESGNADSNQTLDHESMEFILNPGSQRVEISLNAAYSGNEYNLELFAPDGREVLRAGDEFILKSSGYNIKSNTASLYAFVEDTTQGVYYVQGFVSTRLHHKSDVLFSKFQITNLPDSESHAGLRVFCLGGVGAGVVERNSIVERLPYFRHKSSVLAYGPHENPKDSLNTEVPEDTEPNEDPPS